MKKVNLMILILRVLFFPELTLPHRAALGGLSAP